MTNKLKSHTTTNNGSLILGFLIGLLFVIVGPFVLISGESGATLGGIFFFGIGLLVAIICGKGLLKAIKKSKIKKHKNEMNCIIAKVCRFDVAEIGRSKRGVGPQLNVGGMSFGKTETKVHLAYYFTATDGNKEYESEEFDEKIANAIGFLGNIEEYFQMHQLPYNPSNPEENINTIKRAEEETNIAIRNEGFLKQQLLKARLASLSMIKKGIEDGETYMEINGHTLKKGDTVNVYINPKDSECYWIDTDYLYN